MSIGAQRIDDEAPFEFLCECDDHDCKRVEELTAAQFRARRPGAIVAHDSPTTYSQASKEVFAEA